ncbi:thiamine phosphate synthase [Vibrio ziniensis]|uniref:Thiamine-phosphate synthase n=1 Tax=Vibrio ziniensis TaxID=2711221 RepID=A0A6G7CLY3_9VIBR|nr:thiamine phosphate synthase [Vibrio ziniensis]QIH43112.1 thiamine phosphate synthase [Vibrio ziniensis]
MKILIPSHCLEFTGEVQQVLLLAQMQGFYISDIELGVSPTQFIELVDRQTSRIFSNLFNLDNEEPQKSFLDLSYGVEPNASISSSSVSIGVIQSGRLVDCWQHLGVDTHLVDQYASSKTAYSDVESWRHFAWVVSCLALDFPLEDALVLSRAAMNVSRETWPTQFENFPTIEQQSVPVQSIQFARLNKQSLGLYPVVDSVEWVERLLNLGITTLQIRIKDPTQNDLEKQIAKAIELGKQFKAQVFINDYWQLALKHKAFGVHLGQEDVLEADLDEIADSGLALGLSTHGYFELLRIHQLSPSYIALGHIFPTTTKQMPSKPQGLVRLGLYQKLLDSMPYGDAIGVPSVAIGGIDLSNIEQVAKQGVNSIAVVRAITQATNVTKAVSELTTKLNQSSLNKKEAFDVIG